MWKAYRALKKFLLFLDIIQITLAIFEIGILQKRNKNINITILPILCMYVKVEPKETERTLALKGSHWFRYARCVFQWSLRSHWHHPRIVHWCQLMETTSAWACTDPTGIALTPWILLSDRGGSFILISLIVSLPSAMTETVNS